MPENTLALFGALQLFFSDIVKGLIPAHVAAFVLKHIREHNAVPLEDVPIADWLSINPKGAHELYSEFRDFCQEIHNGTVDALEAIGQIESVHSHIEQARQRLMRASLRELGFERSQLDFLSSHNIVNLQDLLALTSSELTALKGGRPFQFISAIIEHVRTIPLIPEFGTKPVAA